MWLSRFHEILADQWLVANQSLFPPKSSFNCPSDSTALTKEKAGKKGILAE